MWRLDLSLRKRMRGNICGMIYMLDLSYNPKPKPILYSTLLSRLFQSYLQELCHCHNCEQIKQPNQIYSLDVRSFFLSFSSFLPPPSSSSLSSAIDSSVYPLSFIFYLLSSIFYLLSSIYLLSSSNRYALTTFV